MLVHWHVQFFMKIIHHMTDASTPPYPFPFLFSFINVRAPLVCVRARVLLLLLLLLLLLALERDRNDELLFGRMNCLIRKDELPY